MIEQQKKDLKYLRDVVLNNTANIQGCLKEIENYVKQTSEAIKEYMETWKDPDF